MKSSTDQIRARFDDDVERFSNWARYDDYLAGLRDAAYRGHVFAYIEQEDTPRPLL